MFSVWSVFPFLNKEFFPFATWRGGLEAAALTPALKRTSRARGAPPLPSLYLVQIVAMVTLNGGPSDEVYADGLVAVGSRGACFRIWPSILRMATSVTSPPGETLAR